MDYDVGRKPGFRYDREANLLYIDKCASYLDQRSDEVGDDVIGGLNPSSGESETKDLARIFRA